MSVFVVMQTGCRAAIACAVADGMLTSKFLGVAPAIPAAGAQAFSAGGWHSSKNEGASRTNPIYNLTKAPVS